MADITLTTADEINVGTSGPNTQFTGVAGAAITAGSPVCFDGTGDRLFPADANDAAKDALAGVATRSAGIGEAVTVMRSGFLVGYANLPVPGSLIWVSDTAGALSDTVGTLALIVGTVLPIHGAPLGTAADRMLHVQVSGIGKAA